MEERYFKEKTTAARAFGHLLYMNYLFMGKVLAQLSSSSSMPCLSCTLIGSSSHTRNQSWARDNTAATTCPCFQAMTMVDYGMISTFVVSTPFRHQDLKMFCILLVTEALLSRCCCHEAKTLSLAQLCI